ncbi:MAG: M20/M25/M40 family metallo-hydrolase [Dehalococcoidia bacterium]|nr:M20/M25/M40 family metallo-hydrolase [Dehalococcoidia bacterium]
MIDNDRLLAVFFDLVKIDSPSGEEGAVAEYVIGKLQSMGISSRTDKTGNVIARLPGTGEAILLNAHLDSVMPCRGITCKLDGGIIRSDGTTVLGADDRAGVAIILESVQAAVSGGIPTCPIDIVFTVREETGLWGAKNLDYGQITARQGLIIDHGGPIDHVVVAAPSQNNIEVTVHGVASHAGVNPEDGVNAIAIAAEAIGDFPVGRVDEETTSNVGLIRGGTARNIVPDLVTIVAEARSHDETKLEAQTARMKAAFQVAAARYGGKVDIDIQRSYGCFSVPVEAPVFQRLAAAARSIGMDLKPEKTGGGSDANVFNKRGIQCIILSAGYDEVHTVKEWVSLALMAQSAELVLKAISATI